MVEINSSTKRAILGFFSSLVLLCGISACSDGGSDVPDGGGNSTIAASPDEPAPARPESPLDEYLSLILGAHDPVESARIGQRRAIREEELIAECMHEAGFGYIPYPEGQPGWVDTTLSAQQLDNPDWVSQWGYGLFFGENPIQISFWDDPLHSESDPNREIFESLSPSEQEAWEATLGRPQTWGDDCRRRANDTVMAEQPFNIFLEDEFRPLFEAWQGISADWTNSEGYLAANADWSNCMADSGYPGFDNRIDANNQIGEELFTYRIAERRIGFPQATPQTSPELADLQQREIELALADLNCRTEVNFQARLDASRIEIETQFVNDHQTALRALRDAAEQRGLNWNIWD